MMHKKDVLGAAIMPFSAMEGLNYTNSDFGVCDANGHSSGEHGITVLHAVSTGSGCGLPRVSPSDYYADYQATVRLNSTKSKNTGLNKPRRSRLITLR
jgi:hypothetical protein